MSRKRSAARSVAYIFRLSHDPDLDHVELRITDPASAPVAFIPRTLLRALTDHLHDFADALDREDRNT